MRSAALLMPVFAAVALCVSAPFAQHSSHPLPELESYRIPEPIVAPPETPLSGQQAELGRRLFFDQRLSGPHSHSCATCHNPSLSWGDGQARATGVNGATLPLRSPTLLTVVWQERFGWDGKFKDLESVSLAPLANHLNMGLSEDELLRRLEATPTYVNAFAQAFEDGQISRNNVAAALAAFQRTIKPGEAPFDRWLAGDEAALSPEAKRGFTLFTGKAGCAGCHSGWTFSDGSFHDIGSASGPDIGRGRLFPTSVKLRYAFKTPTLRDVARRAPYMHDGSVPTLEAVLDLYDRGGIDRPSRSPEIRPLSLTAEEKAALLAFLNNLTAEDHLSITSGIR